MTPFPLPLCPLYPISTHTLTWSVTLVSSVTLAVSQFQLTRSRGAWRIAVDNSQSVAYFNSHAHVERDERCWVGGERRWVFQLTRSRGAWPRCSECKTEYYAFQLTRSRGAWLSSRSIVTEFFDFNSHAHVERDKDKETVIDAEFNFNSHAHVERDCRFSPIQERAALFQLTRSRGAWRGFNDLWSFAIYFNSHAHVERDSHP